MRELTPGELRDEVWARLTQARVAAYPLPVHGHHPNFKGAASAASLLLGHLTASGRLAPGDLVLAYPDYVLRPLRQGALEAGVDLVVPAKHGQGWRLLKSREVEPREASSIAGAERCGERLAERPPARLAFVACVAVDAYGFALGKGYGFGSGHLSAELAGLPCASIAHPLQLVPRVPAPTLRLELWATPADVRHAARPLPEAC